MNSQQITRLSWKHDEVPAEINNLLTTLSAEYPISDGGRGLKLKFKKIEAEENVSRVIRSRGAVEIEYSTLSGAARGIGTALAKLDGEESTPFKSLGVMLDLSRGLVMKVEHVKKWLRRLALSGYNQVLLYCEDTYELEDEPFFGAFRGGYSLEELQEMDDYAASLGVELVGCIQTLAHLNHVLRYPAYEDIVDTPTVMMVGAPGTEALVEKMIAFWSKALRSRRIHVGMDEAHGLGRGKYQTVHGPNDPFELMTRQLDIVSRICEKHGLAPMIWSDMFFRLTNPKHEYYDTTSPFPAGLSDKINPQAQLVYWDYYNESADVYSKMIRRHRELGKEPIMGSGIWTWGRAWYDHNKTVATAVPCIEACRQEKLTELFFTMWGDDGAYCDYDSSFAGIVYCGDLAFGSDDEDRTAQRFEAICFADYEAHISAGELQQANIAPAGADPLQCRCQFLMWDDPLLGMYFDSCKRANPEFDLQMLDILDDTLCRIMPHLYNDNAGNIAYAVALIKFTMRKLELRGALEAAYDSGDMLALHELVTTTIPAAQAALREVARLFRKIWLTRAKAFGLETIQDRWALQDARLTELSTRLTEFINGEINAIDELEARLPWSAGQQNFYGFKGVALPFWSLW